MHPFLRLPPSLVECAFREGARCSPSTGALSGSSRPLWNSNSAGPATREYSSLASTSTSSWNTPLRVERRGQALWRGRLAEQPGARAIQTSACRADHYSTLGIPRTATKAQIKSHFYKLSKQHHPDVSKDPNSKQAFARVSEAYSVLGDDRQRRLYDRTLGHRHATASNHPSRRPPASQSYNAEWSFDPHRRAPGATHAWERRRPPPDYTQQQQHEPHRPNMGSQRPPPGHYQPTGFYQPNNHQPFGGSTSRQAAYSARMESVERELNRVQRVSSVGRAATVTSVVFIALYLLSFARV
ncbi:hypothetical protein GGF50DRAFT_64752 [Schizophyllum commune]